MKTRFYLVAACGAVCMAGAIILNVVGFLCTAGLISALAYYGVCLLGALFVLFRTDQKYHSKIAGLLIVLSIVYGVVLPVTMLNHSISSGGIDLFLNQRLTQYIVLEAGIFIILLLSSSAYTASRNLYRKKLFASFLSPLVIAFLVRIGWLIIMETRHVADFSINYPHFRVEYIVFASIPLFIFVLVLNIMNIKAGYQLGFLISLAHVILVLLLVIMGRNPGLGPFVVIGSCLGIMFFSVKSVYDYHFNNNLPLGLVERLIMKLLLTIRQKVKNHKYILEKLDVKSGKILDYGCGIGSYALAAARLVGESGCVVAVDQDQSMLETIARRCRQQNIGNISTIKVADPEALPDGDFTYILAFNVLQFIKEKTGFINSLFRKLREGGAMLIKFEHITRKQRTELLGQLANFGIQSIQLYKDYWKLQ